MSSCIYVHTHIYIRILIYTHVYRLVRLNKRSIVHICIFNWNETNRKIWELKTESGGSAATFHGSL